MGDPSFPQRIFPIFPEDDGIPRHHALVPIAFYQTRPPARAGRRLPPPGPGASPAAMGIILGALGFGICGGMAVLAMRPSSAGHAAEPPTATVATAMIQRTPVSAARPPIRPSGPYVRPYASFPYPVPVSPSHAIQTVAQASSTAPSALPVNGTTILPSEPLISVFGTAATGRGLTPTVNRPAMASATPIVPWAGWRIAGMSTDILLLTDDTGDLVPVRVGQTFDGTTLIGLNVRKGVAETNLGILIPR